MKAVVTGGGTGGHIMPAIAVAEAMRDLLPDVQVDYVGATGGMEARMVADAGLPFHGITARKLRKVVSPSTVAAMVSLLRGCKEAAVLLRGTRPDVVLGTGGYVAAATTYMAARLRIPTLIQEQNAVPGRTNRFLAGRVDRICLSFPDDAGIFPRDRSILTGVPIRSSMVASRSAKAAREELGLNAQSFVLLVVGGSQGAQRLNAVVLDAATKLHTTVQVVHLTGSANAHEVAATARERGLDPNRYQSHAFFDSDRMALAYAASDVIFCRCGASTLAEATANGLPVLMTPLPSAYADHQTANARAVERAGAGVLMPQDTLTPERLVDEVEKLRRGPVALERMASASRHFGKADAAVVVAGIALQLARCGRAASR